MKFYSSFYSGDGKGGSSDKNINSLFEDNKVVLWLPSLSISHDNDWSETKPNPDFLKLLVHNLDGLDKSYLYKLEFSLFLHTDDREKEVVYLLAPDSGINPSKMCSNDMMNYLLAMKILYANYKYRGYHVFHSDTLDFDSIKSLNEYCHLIYKILVLQVTTVNETLDEDGFIEF